MTALHVAILLFYIGVAATALGTAVYVWTRQPAHGAKAFAVYAAAMSAWSFLCAFELMADNLDAKLTWASVQFATALAIPPAWIVFSVQHGRRQRRLERSARLLLSVAPAVLLALVLSEPWHHLVWGNARVEIMSGVPRLAAQFGVVLWVHAVYLLSTFLLGSLLLAQGLQDSPRSYRPRTSAYLIGLLVPWIVGPAFAIHVARFAPLSVVPVTLTVSAAIVARGLFRRKLDIMPIARRAVVEALADAVLVVGPDNRVVDMNPTAERELGHSYEEGVGRPVDEVVGVFPELASALWTLINDPYSGADTEVQVATGAATRTFHVRITTLNEHTADEQAGPNGDAPTRVLILHDVSRQKRAEESERAQRQLAEGQASTLARRERHLALLNELNQTAIAAADPDSLLQQLADKLVEVIGADICYITRWDASREAPVPMASSGVPTETYRDVTFDPDEPSITRYVLEHGDALTIEDVEESELAASGLRAQLPGRSLIGMPLIAENRKLGAIIMGYLEPHRFKLDEVAFCRQAAAHVALAIAGALHSHSERRAQARAETMREAVLALTSSLELGDVLNTLLSYLARIVPYESGLVMLTRPNNQIEVRAVRGYDPDDDSEPEIGTRMALRDFPHLQLLVITQEGLLVQDTQHYADWKRMPGTEHVRSWLGVPLVTSGATIGVYSAHATQPGVFDEQHLRVAETLAAQAAFAVQNAQLFDQVQRLALTDPLTGINNRRHFFELAEREFERARRYGRPLSALMLDLDHFKQVNDRHGHLVGDEVLREVAALCEQSLRDADFLGRYGGEELVMLLPETAVAEASNAAERIRRRIADVPIITRGGSVNVTVSLGVASIHDEMPDVLTLIDAADAALYESKQGGRNQVTNK